MGNRLTVGVVDEIRAGIEAWQDPDPDHTTVKLVGDRAVRAFLVAWYEEFGQLDPRVVDPEVQRFWVSVNDEVLPPQDDRELPEFYPERLALSFRGYDGDTLEKVTVRGGDGASVVFERPTQDDVSVPDDVWRATYVDRGSTASYRYMDDRLLILHHDLVSEEQRR